MEREYILHQYRPGREGFGLERVCALENGMCLVKTDTMDLTDSCMH